MLNSLVNEAGVRVFLCFAALVAAHDRVIGLDVQVETDYVYEITAFIFCQVLLEEGDYPADNRCHSLNVKIHHFL